MSVEDLALFQAAEVLQTFERMLQKLKIQKQQVANINSWLRPELEVGFQLPRKATTEHKRSIYAFSHPMAKTRGRQCDPGHVCR